jgi:LysM repeat protein
MRVRGRSHFDNRGDRPLIASWATLSRRRTIALAAALWSVVCVAAVCRAQSDAAQPAAASPSTAAPSDAREQQFEILTQAVTALCQEIARNNERSEELTAESMRLRAKVASLRRELDSSEAEDERLRSRAEALEKQLREVGATLPEAPKEDPRAGVAPSEAPPQTKSVTSRPKSDTVAKGTFRPEPPGSDGEYHVVAPGENLYRIGMEHGIDYRELASANRIEDPSHIEIGQRIYIPHANR